MAELVLALCAKLQKLAICNGLMFTKASLSKTIAVDRRCCLVDNRDEVNMSQSGKSETQTESPVLFASYAEEELRRLRVTEASKEKGYLQNFIRARERKGEDTKEKYGIYFVKQTVSSRWLALPSVAGKFIREWWAKKSEKRTLIESIPPNWTRKAALAAKGKFPMKPYVDIVSDIESDGPLPYPLYYDQVRRKALALNNPHEVMGAHQDEHGDWYIENPIFSNWLRANEPVWVKELEAELR